MANYCEYEMKITGRAEDIEAFKEASNIHGYFGRVYSMMPYDHEELDDGTVRVDFYGDCAWSVYSACGLEYNDCTLLKFSKEHDLFIEVFSSELGFEFQEHFVIKCGNIEVSEVFDYQEGYKDEFESVEQFNEFYGTSFTQKEFDEAECSLIIKSGFPDGYSYDDFTVKDIDEYLEETTNGNNEH